MKQFYSVRLAIGELLPGRQSAEKPVKGIISAFSRKSLFMHIMLTTILLGGLMASSAFAQNRQISGTVLDASGSTLPSASILVKGTTTGVVTNEKGQYSLQVPGGSTLVFSYIGYVSQEVAVENRTTIDVNLQADAASLSEVVVVGYTTQSKTKVTSAVSKLGETEVRNTPNANPIQSFQGKMAGVSIPISTGQPGLASANIIIRGGTKSNVYGTDSNNALASNASDVTTTIPLPLGRSGLQMITFLPSMNLRSPR